MYADDTTIYTIGSSVDQVILSLNGLMAQISMWSTLNKLTIHPVKTEAMIKKKTTVFWSFAAITLWLWLCEIC